ncbi:hypothetical protein [Tropicibacter naphthalenivorans]|uniref:Uncharacterized protein n=1 Tax=Tropicibacter naphthalenivorans TaxID=441103 RepID=A0A0P1GGW1_9RHOB|nr:hypothetical protein [Tropicibacter naphthalenivorans]CUH75570.1 hypothetical protein TRN7648_00506 [Tropicibacter naphthalenivorans]SMC43602.1 hypothetical protein SAMN04488093_101373 [Tropicibacter naphthalenivorans]
MSTADIWGPWITHDGKGCPLRPGTIVEIVAEDRFGFTLQQIACVTGGAYSSWNWRFYPRLKRILRYRVKKPNGLTILEDRLQSVQSAPMTPVSWRQ